MTDNKETQDQKPSSRDKTKISLPRILALLSPYRWRIVAAAIMLVLTNGLGLLFPLVLRTFLNTILVQHNEHLLNLVVGVLFVVFLLQAALGAVQGYIITSLGERLSFDLRTTLFRHLQRLPLSFFDHRRTGELMMVNSMNVRRFLRRNIGNQRET